MNMFSKQKKAMMAVVLGLGVFASAYVPTSVQAAYDAPQKHQINVLPIDNAKFLQGQKFDFTVEIADAKDANMDVKVNGQDAAKFFGKKADQSLDGTTAVYRINDVSFPKAGTVKVDVKDDGLSRSVEYNVTNEVAQKKAKNVILFIGDGMSLQAKQMGRILSKGIKEGKYNDLLNMEKMPNMALITTSGYDSLTTDSANSASAYATGHKSVVNAMGVYENHTKDPLDDPRVENIIELVKRTRDMGTGVVTTASVTDATPAAMLTHTRRRAEQNYIAADMLVEKHRPDVILGGGSRYFTPQSAKGSKRTDNRNLISEFEQLGYSYSSNQKELDATSLKATKLLGLYTPNTMDVYLDREVLKNPAVLKEYNNQPNLIDMTDKALNALEQNKNGFFLMVEGASIDKQLHAMDWQRATYDTIEFDKAVGLGQEFAKKHPDTLLIVVADHAHGASITGTYTEKYGKTGREAVGTYAKSEFPTFEDKNDDGFPDDPNPDVTLAVQYANHPDMNTNYKLLPVPTPGSIMKDGKAIANPDIKGEFQPGNIPDNDSSEAHAADDIVLMAQGPGSEYFHGVMDNTEVFFGIVRALGIDGNTNSK